MCHHIMLTQSLHFKVAGAKSRLGFAMKNGDAADLASALTWAAEVVNRGGQLNEVCLLAQNAMCLRDCNSQYHGGLFWPLHGRSPCAMHGCSASGFCLLACAVKGQ